MPWTITHPVHSNKNKVNEWLMRSLEVKKHSFLSFPRERESSLSEVFWTPTFVGVTTWGLFASPTFNFIKEVMHEKGCREEDSTFAMMKSKGLHYCYQGKDA